MIQEISVNINAPVFGKVVDPTVTSENDVVSQAEMQVLLVFVKVSKTSVHFPISELTLFTQVSCSPKGLVDKKISNLF